MLENIKLILGVLDTSKDELIKYHINSVTTKLLVYCGIDNLPKKLESIVEEIVINRFKDKQVKREKIGDYEKEYAISNSTQDELAPYKETLKNYKSNIVRFV